MFSLIRKNYQELSFNQDYQKWIDSNGELPFPNGESKAEFIKRSMRGFRQLLEEVKDSTKPLTIAAVVHGGTIMSIASSILGKDYYDYQVRNGEYIIL